jgi:CheY-like chemotaxis protein
MNGILGFAELLKRPSLTKAKHQQYLEIIKQSGERMLNIINDLVDISKIEAGQVDVKWENTDIKQLLESLHTFFKPQAKKQSLSFICKTDIPKSNPQIVTDKTKLSQILSNLIKNALKYTEEGHITFGCSFKDSEILFYVEDSGEGISSEVQKKIFERFRQGDLSMRRADEGAGLGLSISKAYVTMLEGDIWVDSTPGKGSAFYFTIPIKKPDEDISEESGEEPISYEKIKPLTILIAEDDDTSYLFLEELLAKANCTIIRAYNGKEAIELVKNHPEINLILMDLKMPQIDGIEATQEIKKISPDVPIIAQTAYAMSKDKDDAINAGCSNYISKPIKKRELLKMIETYGTNEQK